MIIHFSSPYNFLTLLPLKKEETKEPGFSNVTCECYFIQDIHATIRFYDTLVATFKVLAPNKYKATQHLHELQQYVK